MAEQEIFEPPEKTTTYIRGSQTFPSRDAFFQLQFFHGALLYIIYFGRAEEGLLLQQIEKLTKLGTIGGNLQFSLSPSLFTVVKRCKNFIHMSNK